MATALEGGSINGSRPASDPSISPQDKHPIEYKELAVSPIHTSQSTSCTILHRWHFQWIQNRYLYPQRKPYNQLTKISKQLSYFPKWWTITFNLNWLSRGSRAPFNKPNVLLSRLVDLGYPKKSSDQQVAANN